MTNRSWDRLTGLLCAIALAGCGSSSSSSGPGTAKAFCRQLASLETQMYEHCSGETIPGYFVMETILDCQGFGEAQAAGRIAYDSGRARACLDSLRTMSCAEGAQYFESIYFEWAALPAVCRQAVAPKVAGGDPCTSVLGYECVGGYCNVQGVQACFEGGATCQTYVAESGDCSTYRCTPGTHCASGTCVADTPVTILGQGGDCSAANTTCADGLRCSGGSCVARTAASGDCSSTSECLEGLICDTVCTERYPVGHACSGGDCAPGLYCNDATGCAAYPRLGETCVQPASGDYAACVDSFCDDTATPTPVCTAYLEPGATCYVDESMERLLTVCGPGYACYPLAIGSNSGYGVCGRIYCVPF